MANSFLTHALEGRLLLSNDESQLYLYKWRYKFPGIFAGHIQGFKIKEKSEFINILTDRRI